MMSCCAPSAEPTAPLDADERYNQEILLASRELGDGTLQTELSVPAAHCAGCIRAIEGALSSLPGIRSARVNLTAKRVTIRWDAGSGPPPFIAALDGAGYAAHLHGGDATVHDKTFSSLIRALAVAGFASSNIMLLSVAVWMGADDRTRSIFHQISAAIALVAIAYSGRVFFVPAWRALRRLRTNMDVPISVGVLMAVALSLYETARNGQHAYFDAAVSLLFVLLIGRTLDTMMRDKARTAAASLARLAARGALVVDGDQGRAYLPLEEIRPGMRILLAAGERVPVDGRIVEGRSSLDVSIVSGEGAPSSAAPGTLVQAGTLNLSSPLTMVATRSAGDSFIAEMTRMIEAAVTDRLEYRRLTDRVARLYAPVVHLAAALAFAGWLLATGDLYRAATIAIAVLIITCPCALRLAVPMVQAIAARRLFEHGILLRNGSALERLVEIDTVIFDKTGTLTLGTPQLRDHAVFDPEALQIAAAMANRSHHPYAKALATIASARAVPFALDCVEEHAGRGLEARAGLDVFRLGNPAWALGADDRTTDASVVLAKNGQLAARFAFAEQLRPDSRRAVAQLGALGMSLETLSGDRRQAVEATARDLGMPFRAQVDPAGKIDYIKQLQGSGHKVLMVGDGINDAPALAAAHASMTPGSASDVGRASADLIFLHRSLMAVPQALQIAARADALIRQNLWIAAFYNVVSVPLAVLGLVTPLIAAVAMSASSLTIIANSLRLRAGEVKERKSTASRFASSGELGMRRPANG